MATDISMHSFQRENSCPIHIIRFIILGDPHFIKREMFICIDKESKQTNKHKYASTKNTGWRWTGEKRDQNWNACKSDQA